MNRTLIIIPLLFMTIQIFSQTNQTNRTSAKISDGYGNLKWGTLLSDAREKITGKLVFTDEKSVIISKDGNLKYYYGFFYVDPAVSKAGTVETSDKSKDSNKQDEGKLFYISLKFPYLSMKIVEEKIEEKYGPSTNENITKNQGAIAWDSEKTIIIMWVDRYEKRPFCRRITYLSKDIAKELNEYNNKVFNKVEMELIKQLNP